MLPFLGACSELDRKTSVIIITADDLNWDSVGAFGSSVADSTPNIDKLASEGMSFQRAHVASAICIPSRSSMFTGLYPHNNGAQGFEPINEGVTTLTEMLYYRLYFNGIIGKVNHLQPTRRFFWHETVGEFELGHGRDPEKYYAATLRLLNQAAALDKPAFLNVNIEDPHRPFASSKDEIERYGELDYPPPSRQFTEDEVSIPGFLPDLSPIRKEVAQYFSSVRRADDILGAILAALDTSDVPARDTLVIFLSDNGMAFPFAKTNCYLSSTKTPLVIRWPAHVAAGGIDDEHYVSTIDLMPTILEILGITVPLGMDGQSIKPLLLGRKFKGRQFLVTSMFETAAENRYPMRCYHFDGYGYIYNEWSNQRTVFYNESHKGLTMAAMVQAAETDPYIAERVNFFYYRTREELYDFDRDPNALHNLTVGDGHLDQWEEFRDLLLAWMVQSRDPLADKYSRVLNRLRGN